MSPNLPAIMGHRGVPSIAPENTILGFRTCFELGARWTETDVCVLGDGTPVIFHDAALERCTGEPGSVADIGAGDLHRIDANQAFPELGFQPIPKLSEALECFQALGMSVNLELKKHDHVAADALVSATIEGVRAADFASEQILFSSFDFECLRLARKALPRAALAVIAEDAGSEVFDVAQEVQASALNLWWETLSYAQVQKARERGLAVNIWTANDPSKVTSMAHWGISGIMSDYPQRFFKAETAV